MPAFGPGHNGFAAWGLTAAHADNTDLFLEQVGPDGRSLRRGDAFVPCEVREERVVVRGGEDVVEDVLLGPRGPVVVAARDDAVPAVAFPPRANALSMSATWLGDRPYRGLYRAPDVRSFEQFRRLFGDDPARWAWGTIRPLTLRHPASEVPVVGTAFDIGPFEGEGDNTTISQGGLDFVDPLRNQT